MTDACQKLSCPFNAGMFEKTCPPLGDIAPVDILFVGECPDENDERQQRIFSGVAGAYLKDTLSQLGISSYAITNVIKCCPKDRKVTSKVIKVCTEYLYDEIRKCSPNVIVPLGKLANSIFSGNNKSISSVRGKVYYSKDFAVKVVPLLPPSEVYTDKNLSAVFKQDLNYVLRESKSKELYQIEGDYKILDTASRVFDFKVLIGEYPSFSFDLETSGVNFMEDVILGIGFSFAEKTGFYIPLRNEGKKFWDRSEAKEILMFLRELFVSSQEKYAHNGKFDIQFLNRIGIEVKNFNFDTMLAHHLLDETTPHGLKNLARKYLDIYGYDSQINDVKDKLAEVSLDVLGRYCAIDCDCTFRLQKIFSEQLKVDARLNKLFAKLIMPFQEVVKNAELRGVKINREYLTSLADRYKVDVVQLEKDIKQLVGREINISSPKQLQELFFKDLGFKPTKKTEKGNVSVDEEVIEELAEKNDIAKLLLQHRKKLKLSNTFLDPMLLLLDSEDRVHTEYHIAGTVTGRVSCVPLESEILTVDGWKHYEDICIGQKVLGFDLQSKEYIWTSIKKLHFGKGSIGLLKINKGHDSNYRRGFWCTADHQWVVVKDEMIGFSKTKFIPKKFRVLLQPKKYFPSVEKSILTDSQAGLLGWYLTDGDLTGGKGKIKKYGLGISLAKSRSIQILEELLLTNNIKHSKHKYRPYDKDSHYVTAFHVGCNVFNPLYSILIAHTPSELIMKLSISARKSMFSAMLEGDGSMRRDAKRYDRFGALKNQKKNTCDYFETLSISLGQPYTSKELLRNNFQKNPFINYQLTTNEIYANPNTNWKEEREGVAVWCPETDCGTWVMRQNNNITITGNSSHPNLQNIPNNEEFRRMFVPRDGYKFIIADFSQIELRVLAKYSNDKRLVDAFKNGDDVHKTTASLIFGVKLDEVTKEQRSIGKTINFGLVYGLGAGGLAGQLKVPYKDAKAYMDSFFRKYYSIKAWMDKYKREAMRRGYTENLFGRKRRLLLRRDVSEANENGFSLNDRQIINTPIQGTASDLTSYVCIQIAEKMRGEKLDSELILTVHDELVYETLERDVDKALEIIKGVMTKPFGDRDIMGIPIEISIEVCNHWT